MIFFYTALKHQIKPYRKLHSEITVKTLIQFKHESEHFMVFSSPVIFTFLFLMNYEVNGMSKLLTNLTCRNQLTYNID